VHRDACYVATHHTPSLSLTLGVLYSSKTRVRSVSTGAVSRSNLTRETAPLS